MKCRTCGAVNRDLILLRPVGCECPPDQPKEQALGIRRIPFDVMVLARLLIEGSEFKVDQGLPKDATLVSYKMDGTLIEFMVSSKEFAQDVNVPELDIQIREFGTKENN